MAHLQNNKKIPANKSQGSLTKKVILSIVYGSVQQEQQQLHMCTSVCINVTQLGCVPSRGEVTSQPRPLCPPPHMTWLCVSEFFHWPLGQVPPRALFDFCRARVCVCVRSCWHVCAGIHTSVCVCVVYFHLWYYFTHSPLRHISLCPCVLSLSLCFLFISFSGLYVCPYFDMYSM